ncbi:hypothetical protein [Pseudorhodoplanes sp.]|uniref:hypothetical protein n=1 Tax=Pseudorhodoplanes sp. TaxID=1934341 RepID=UPI00391BD727
MIERTTVRLPAELLDRARRKAAAEGRTLTSLIEEGLRDKVEANPKKRPDKRVMPRVSKAKGGPRPGFEDNPHRIAQDIEDLDYVERMRRSFE